MKILSPESCDNDDQSQSVTSIARPRREPPKVPSSSQKPVRKPPSRPAPKLGAFSAPLQSPAPVRAVSSGVDTSEIFAALDKNSDGVLTPREIILGVRKNPDYAKFLGVSTRITEGVTRDRLMEVFGNMDINQDDGVDLEEFKRWEEGVRAVSKWASEGASLEIGDEREIDAEAAAVAGDFEKELEDRVAQVGKRLEAAAFGMAVDTGLEIVGVEDRMVLREPS